MEKWNGFDSEKIIFEGHEAIIVYPEEGKSNSRLAVKTEYWGAFPGAIEIPLLECGFHLCYIKNDNRFGMNYDLDRKARFIRYVSEKCGLNARCVPIGMSCGGLIAIKLAARYPELIECLYVDAPVLNYMSWPCGFGIGKTHPTDHTEVLSSLGLDSLSELLSYREMPLDMLPRLIEAKIPVIMATGDSDTVVPYCENGIFLERAYKNAGLEIEVYVKPGGDHHPHGLPSHEPILDFILRHCFKEN